MQPIKNMQPKPLNCIIDPYKLNGPSYFNGWCPS